jgi:hypothetical protein
VFGISWKVSELVWRHELKARKWRYDENKFEHDQGALLQMPPHVRALVNLCLRSEYALTPKGLATVRLMTTMLHQDHK